MISYTVTLTCGSCKTALRFEDERPSWKTYDYRVEQAEECEKSAAFVVAWDEKPLPGIGERWPEWEAAGRPAYITSRHAHDPEDWMSFGHRGEGSMVVLDIPSSYRYIDCPVCDARIPEPREQGGGADGQATSIRSRRPRHGQDVGPLPAPLAP